MKSHFVVGLFALVLIAVGAVAAQNNPMVGGAAMYPDKNIVENAANSADHTTLVTAVKAAGLVDSKCQRKYTVDMLSLPTEPTSQLHQFHFSTIIPCVPISREESQRHRWSRN